MAANNCKKCYFVVWTPVGEPHLELSNFNEPHWDDVYRNLLLFYKSYLAKVLLEFQDLHLCPTCEKYILEPPGFDEKEQVESTSYLGVIFNDNLKRSKHLSSFSSKASRILGMMRINLWNCPKKVKEKLPTLLLCTQN